MNAPLPPNVLPEALGLYQARRSELAAIVAKQGTGSAEYSSGCLRLDHARNLAFWALQVARDSADVEYAERLQRMQSELTTGTLTV